MTCAVLEVCFRVFSASSPRQLSKQPFRTVSHFQTRFAKTKQQLTRAQTGDIVPPLRLATLAGLRSL